MSHLLEFYGTECPYCVKMRPLVEKLEKEEKLQVEKIEVWHNTENRKRLEEIDNGELCGGVPFFYNTNTKKWICGSAPYEGLKAWATENV